MKHYALVLSTLLLGCLQDYAQSAANKLHDTCPGTISVEYGSFFVFNYVRFKCEYQ